MIDLKVLKVLSRLYVHNLNEVVNFYENIFDTKTSMRFSISQINLELAQVGDVLIIAGTEDALKPFIDTRATFLVDSVNDFRKYLNQNGAIIIREPKEVPTGINMTVKHADGSIIEYVEHR